MMDTKIGTVESNIDNLDNSVNHMAHMFTKFMREMKQVINPAPSNHPPSISRVVKMARILKPDILQSLR